MQALALFQEKYPSHRKDEIDQCIRGATEFIEKLQNDDGSWSVLLYMTIERFQFGTLVLIGLLEVLTFLNT
jgi:hypothetical protein